MADIEKLETGQIAKELTTEGEDIIPAKIQPLQLADIVSQTIAVQVQVHGRPNVVVGSNGQGTKVPEAVKDSSAELAEFAIIDGELAQMVQMAEAVRMQEAGNRKEMSVGYNEKCTETRRQLVNE